MTLKNQMYMYASPKFPIELEEIQKRTSQLEVEPAEEGIEFRIREGNEAGQCSGSGSGSSSGEKFHPIPTLIVMSSTKKERWIYNMYVCTRV